MRIASIFAMTAVLGVLAGGITPARAHDDPDKLPPMTAKQFADRVGTIICVLADHYYYEIDSGDLLRWAVNGLYGRRQSKVPDEIAVRLEKASNSGRKELNDILAAVADNCGGDLRWCADIAAERLLSHLDGRTELIDRKFILYETRSLWVGIGVRLEVDPKSGLPRVVYPHRDGSAYKAGLRSGDVITEITRQTGNVNKLQITVSATKDMSLAQFDATLRGKAGTEVRLKVQRAGVADLLEFKLARAESDEETVLGTRRNKDDRWIHWLDAAHTIAYVRLTQFREQTRKDAANVVVGLHNQGMKALILDLRNSKGGYLLTADSIAGLFVGDAPLYTIRFRNEAISYFKKANGKGDSDFSVVCLANMETANSAVVLAAGLQDNKRAIIAGERTSGDASIIHLYQLDSTCVLRVPGAVYFRPSGKKLDRIHPPGKPSDEWGVTPDKGFELALTAKERDQLRAHFENQLIIPPPGQAKEQAPAFKDRQLEMAVEYLRSRIQPGQGSPSS